MPEDSANTKQAETRHLAAIMFTTMLTTAPDIHTTIEDLFAENDKVAVRWTFRGTRTEQSLIKGEPTGEPFAVVAIAIYRFANGKIEEDWGVEAQ